MKVAVMETRVLLVFVPSLVGYIILVLGVVNGQVPTTLSYSTASPSQHCGDCLTAGRCQQSGIFPSSGCTCNQGFHGPSCKDCVIVCLNAGKCVPNINGAASCRCIQGTSGTTCHTHTMTHNSSGLDNIAVGRPFVHCRDVSMNTDLANINIWHEDVCYNVTTDNVIIVDLGEAHNVKDIRFTAQNTTAVNVSVTVGERLSAGCGVMNSVLCATVIGRPLTNNTIAVCNTASGRYIRVRNNIKLAAVLCIEIITGTLNPRTILTARFAAKSMNTPSFQVPAFVSFASVSAIDCARKCLKNPKCLNFSMASSTCWMYGGPAMPQSTRRPYSLISYSG